MRTVLIYLALVGLPLLGVILVLREGRALPAPLAVGGPWYAEATALQPCHGIEPGRPLHILQSGLWLDARIGRHLTMHGTLHGDQLRLDGDVEAEDGCPEGVLAFEARVIGPTEARALEGELTRRGCAACPALPLRLVRGERSTLPSAPAH